MADAAGPVSPRTAELALVALRRVLHLAEHVRNGAVLPEDIVTALAELDAAAAATRGNVDPGSRPVPRSQHIGTAEAAERLGLSVRTVQERCAAGRLPAVRIGRRSWAVKWEEPWVTTWSAGPSPPEW